MLVIYDSTNLLVCIEKCKNELHINTMIDSKCILSNFEYNFELEKLITEKKILIEQHNEGNLLNVTLKLPTIANIDTYKKLTEAESKTLLSIKSKVHDILGQRISVLNTILNNESVDEEKINDIKPLLRNMLDDLSSNSLVKPDAMLSQIIHTCELSGTKLYVMGNLPTNYIKAVTIVRIIRECSTNAIRHGLSQNIYVQILEKEKGMFEMLVSNDGKVSDTFVEGDGINGMRNRVSELNGTLEIFVDNHFTVKVTI